MACFQDNLGYDRESTLSERYRRYPKRFTTDGFPERTHAQ